MYKYATALVMASHFGPTNMPPIEAMEIGCPVVCSDLGGHREILGDAASYFDSYNIDSMTKSMFDILEHNDIFRERIIEQRKLTIYSSKRSMQILDSLLLDIVHIRANWQN